ncbi:flavin reductase family protein [Agrilactobacillus fermenti]|uniref:flavin reductase family protein n=1 Tax=Agrilactobacillus fermenti TaxID=2586909 RepID=UPI003A5BF1F4
MITYAAQDLSHIDQYKLLSGSVIPRPIAWVTTLNSDTKVVNLAPFSYFSVASNQKPIISLAILRQNQSVKHTAFNILHQKEAVIHIVSAEFAAAMNATAAGIAAQNSELDLINEPLIKSDFIAVPGLVRAKIRLETTLYQHIPLLDKNKQVMTDLLLLEVQGFHFAEHILDETTKHIDVEALQPLGRLAGPNYTYLGKTFFMQRPK